jgi:hypothetical protein
VIAPLLHAVPALTSSGNVETHVQALADLLRR